MSKKIILLISLVIFTVSSLVGCKKDNNKPNTSKTPVYASTPEPTDEPEPTQTISLTEEPAYPTIEPGTGKYHGGIKSEDPFKYEAFDVTTHDSSAVTLTEGDSAALQFFATTSFNEVGFICPSMGDAIGSLTLKLYAWAGTYNRTITQEPLHQKTFNDYGDNTWLVLEFSPLPDGEYLLLAENPVQNVGVWKTNPGWNAVKSWVNGEAVDGVIKNYIQYTNTPNNLYYRISE